MILGVMATTQTAPIPEDSHDPGITAKVLPVYDHEEISRLAYGYWEERQGTGEGSADDDWLRAEREYLSGQTAG